MAPFRPSDPKTCANAAAQDEKPPTSKADVLNNIGDIADKMGMNQKCQRSAKTRTNAWLNHNQAGKQEEAKVMFGLLGSGKGNRTRSSTQSNTSLDDEFRESGCGNLLMDTKNIMTSMTQINCTLNEASAETTVETSANASIQIRVVPPIFKVYDPETGKVIRTESAEDRANRTILSMQQQAMLMQDYPKTQKIIQKTIQDMIQVNMGRGKIKITNSTFKLKASTKIKVINKAVQQVAQKLENNYKDIAQATAENVMQQSMGKNAMQGNVKQLITTNIERRQKDITENITRNLSKVSVKNQGSNQFIIEAPTAIEMDGVVMDGNVTVDIATNALATSSIDLGKQVATELLSDAASKTETTLDNAGLEELQLALNEANKGVLQSIPKLPVMKMGGFDLVQMAIYAAILGAAYKMYQKQSQNKMGWTPVHRTRWLVG